MTANILEYNGSTYAPKAVDVVEYFEFGGVGFFIREKEAGLEDEDERDGIEIGNRVYRASFWRSGAMLLGASKDIGTVKEICKKAVEKHGAERIKQKEKEYIQQYGLANKPYQKADGE